MTHPVEKRRVRAPALQRSDHVESLVDLGLCTIGGVQSQDVQGMAMKEDEESRGDEGHGGGGSGGGETNDGDYQV